MAGTVFTPSLQGMKSVKSENGVILTKPFLEVCKLILPVLGESGFKKLDKRKLAIPVNDTCQYRCQEQPQLPGYYIVTAEYRYHWYQVLVPDKFGSAMSLVKSDIGGNITRLQTKYDTDPTKYENLYSLVQVEITVKTAKSSSSCTNGLLWLTRAMDFLVELFRNLVEHSDWSMSKCCTDSYNKTLKKRHGWVASSSFTVAMKLAPDRNKFMEIIGGAGNINADIEKFCSSFAPFLEENHKFLASVGMDDLKAS